MTPGGAAQEITQLNIESLWAGGPFQDPSYNGGNKQPSEQAAMASAMQGYRDAIFASPTGDIDNISSLATDPGAYGSYIGAGYLVSTLNVTGTVSNYARWLDLDQGIARVSWTQAGSAFTRELFCSHPTQACTQHIGVSTPNTTLPALTFAFASALESNLPTPNITCLDAHTLRVRGTAGTPGMLYEFLARARTTGGSVTSGAPPNATLVVPRSSASEAWLSWTAGTEFDQDAGDAAHGFAFRARRLQYGGAHVADVEKAYGGFALDLGQQAEVGKATETRALLGAYEVDTGNVYLEVRAFLSVRYELRMDVLQWLMFNYGRYLLASSARGALPANLQGKWALDTGTPWSGGAFIIDANLGLPGAVLNALLQAPDVPSLTTPLVVTLLPALPSKWSTGSIKGARVRGGMTVNLQWATGKPTGASFRAAKSKGQQTGSLAVTALGYWVVFDAIGVAIPHVTLLVSKPYAAARSLRVLLFAQSVYLMFSAVYICKEALEHLLLSAGEGHHHHAGDEDAGIEFPVTTFFALIALTITARDARRRAACRRRISGGGERAGGDDGAACAGDAAGRRRTGADAVGASEGRGRRVQGEGEGGAERVEEDFG
ncbi:glycosyl hydrolase family 65, N-terminal domain-containing protein [Mycena vitilis]|nr:glycosyl hydrolase family 65, N-terminal domain-containing protein [Mycena vitilis]